MHKKEESQFLATQINELQRFVEELESSMEQLHDMKESLLEFESLNENEAILAQVASGVFIEAKLTGSKKLKVNVGNNVVVEKTVPETIKLLEKQEEEIQASMEEAVKKLEQYYSLLYQEKHGGK